MIATSTEYKASIAKGRNRQTFAKVEIDFTDPFVDQSLGVTAVEASSSHKAQVADGIYEPTHNWFPLDGSAILDGSFKLMPPTSDDISTLSMEVGWWSGTVAGAGGSFASPQLLTVTFVERTIESLLVCSDSIKHEYPVDFTIKLYDKDDNLLYTETVTGNTLEYWMKTITAISDVVKQILSITKWSHVGRCAKIYEFFTSIKRTYEGDDLFLTELLEERESETASIPIGNISSNQLTLSIYNRNRSFDAGSGSAIADLIKPMRKLTLSFGAAGVDGVTEWIPGGVFWSQEWSVPDDGINADTVGYDLLSLMAQTSYSPALMTNVTRYDIIQDIFDDYGLLSSMYYIDPELNVEVIPYVAFDATNHREALRLVVEAGSASAFVNRLGVLQVQGPNYLKTNKATSVRTITASEYFSRSAPSRFVNIANIVKVKTQPLIPDITSSQVYDNNTITIYAGETIVLSIQYNTKPCIDAVASIVDSPVGVSITGAVYYPWGADITIQSTSVSDMTIELEVIATPLVVTGSRTAVARDEASINEFGEKIFEFPDNSLIQDYETAMNIANQILSNYSTARRDLTQEWRGDPALELSDRITTDASRVATADYHIVRQTITWDGTLKVSHEGRIVPPEFLLMTEDGYLLMTEDGYLLQTE